MHIEKAALLGLVLSLNPVHAQEWFDTGTTLMKITDHGQIVCHIWVEIPGELIGFSMQDAGREEILYALTAWRVGSVYITTDPDLVTLRGTCSMPIGIAIQYVPPSWSTPPTP